MTMPRRMGRLCFQLNEEEWIKGDMLRFVQVGEIVSRYSDTTITDISSRIVMSEPLSDGEYCWIHIRQTKGKQKVSTQKLVCVSSAGSFLFPHRRNLQISVSFYNHDIV